MGTRLFSLAAAVLTTACVEALPMAPEPVGATEPTDAAKSTVRYRLSNALSDTVLITVDGVPTLLTTGGARPLDPNDIEAIEVIKAASAATLYGPPMKCPAVIINTRRQ